MSPSPFDKEDPEPGRVWLDLSEGEYERMRKALGPNWEWEDGVVMRFGLAAKKIRAMMYR